MGPLKLWHDPQHGGTNKGSEYFGLVERKWVVEMVYDLLTVLPKFNCTQQIARHEDETISYEDRAGSAHGWCSQIAFLHHTNAMVYPDGHELAGKPWTRFDGFMTFYLPRDRIGKEVATVMGQCSPVGLRQRKPTYAANLQDWTANAYRCLVNYERVGIPAVLIEWGFATSPVDRNILTSKLYRPSLCATAACGVGRAVELICGD